MDESFRLKPGRTTPRVRSATPKSGRVASKGIDQQRMMSFIYGSLAGQTIGSEKMKHSLSEQALAKSTSRTPVYKTPEEYYDEVLVLKKKIKELTADNSTQKLKVRRLEEDFQKKEREVEQLLDPLKNNEVRRTLADGKTDSGTVVHSFKQKILKLEQQLREKESAYSKLQSDLKTTKIEEMKIQLETFYNEMIRLKTEKAAIQPDQTLRDGVTPKIGATRVKELTATILKMSVEKTRLLAENKSLKEDLRKCIETKSENGNTNKGLSQKQIMSALAKLEQKFDKFETVDGVKSRGTDGNTVDGGVVATAEEVQRLRQQETELKEEVQRQISVIESIKQDRAYYIEMCQKKDNEIASLKKEVDDLRAENNSSSRHRRDSANAIPPSLRSGPTEEREAPRPKERLSRRKSGTLSSAIDTSKEILEKVKQFKRNRAAKVIQKKWAEHKVKEVVKDEAAELIQESWRGHRARQEISHRLKENEQEEEEERKEKEDKIKEKARMELVEKEREARRNENGRNGRQERNGERTQNETDKLRRVKEEVKEEKRVKEESEDERHDVDYDDAVEVIQSTVRAHIYRSHQIKSNTSNSQTSQPPRDKSSVAESSYVQKTISSRSTAVAAPLSDDDEIAEEIDEDIEENLSDDEEEDIVHPMLIK